MILRLRHLLRVGAILSAPTAAHALGIGGSVGLATGYESQGSRFARGGWSGGATLQVDMGGSAWWQTQMGADYFIQRGERGSSFEFESRTVSIQAFVFTGGLRLRLSDGDAPLPVNIDVGPGIALMHASDAWGEQSATHLAPALAFGVSLGRAVSTTTEVAIRVRGLVSRGYDDPEEVVFGGRQDGLRQVMFMIGVHRTRE